MNDQVQPEDDTNPDAAAERVLKMEAGRAADEQLDETELSDEELAAEEFDDDGDLDDEFDAEEEFADDEEVENVRSLIEEMFDEDDLGEVMSELDVLTLEDAAAYLKVEYGQIRRLLKEQGLPGRKIGDEWRFLRGALADWLRAPGGNAPVAVPAPTAARAPAPAPAPEREERPAQQGRREFNQKPPLRERFAQGQGDDAGQQQRYPQQGGSRYPQQGGSRYPQQGGAGYPRRQYEGGNQGQGGEQGGGYQGQGGQGGYPPPRRPRYGNDQGQQGQQFPQGEYRPPRRPPAGGQGSFDNQGGGGYAGGGARKFGGPKKPKRKALNEQRFKRLDRRRGDGESAGGADSQE